LRYMFECGPGRVLAKIIKRIEHEGVETAVVLDPATLAEAKAILV